MKPVPHRFEYQKRNVKAPVERKGVKKRKPVSIILETISSPVASTCSPQDECLGTSEKEKPHIDKYV